MLQLKSKQIWSCGSEKYQLGLPVWLNYIHFKLSSSKHHSRILNQTLNLKKSVYFFKYLPKCHNYSFSHSIQACSPCSNETMNCLWYQSKFKHCLPFLFYQHFRQAITLSLLDYLFLENCFHLEWVTRITKLEGESNGALLGLAYYHNLLIIINFSVKWLRF